MGLNQRNCAFRHHCTAIPGKGKQRFSDADGPLNVQLLDVQPLCVQRLALPDRDYGCLSSGHNRVRWRAGLFSSTFLVSLLRGYRGSPLRFPLLGGDTAGNQPRWVRPALVLAEKETRISATRKNEVTHPISAGTVSCWRQLLNVRGRMKTS